MLNLYGPSFQGLYVGTQHDDGTSLDAAGWAAAAWFPDAALNITVATLVPVLAFYDYLVLLPREVVIWWRLYRWRHGSRRGVMPIAILWLRYMTILLGIVQCVNLWYAHENKSNCKNVVRPLAYTFTTIVSFSVAAVNVWRIRTLTRAAIQSRLLFSLLQACCVLLLLARLAALITSFTYMHRLSVLVPINPAESNTTCFALHLVLLHAMKVDPAAMAQFAYRAPVYSCLGLLVTWVVSDIIYAVITLASIFHLRTSIQTQTRLISNLFSNAILFYSILVILDVAALAFYLSTSDPWTAPLLAVLGSILTVRVLINEQEYILRAHRRSHTCYAAGTQRELDAWTVAAPTVPAGAFSREHDVRTPGQGHTHTHEQQHQHFGLLQRLARMASGGSEAKIGCEICKKAAAAQRPHPAGRRRGRRFITSKDVQRRGAGLTDIERVTVLEHGRSIDRPWPTWDGEEEEDSEGEIEADFSEHGEGRRAYDLNSHRRFVRGARVDGVQTLIRDWWRDVDRQASVSPGLQTCNGHHQDMMEHQASRAVRTLQIPMRHARVHSDFAERGVSNLSHRQDRNRDIEKRSATSDESESSAEDKLVRRASMEPRGTPSIPVIPPMPLSPMAQRRHRNPDAYNSIASDTHFHPTHTIS